MGAFELLYGGIAVAILVAIIVAVARAKAKPGPAGTLAGEPPESRPCVIGRAEALELLRLRLEAGEIDQETYDRAVEDVLRRTAA